MIAKELIDALSKCNSDHKVHIVCEDEVRYGTDRNFKVYEVESVSSAETVPCRLDDGSPYLKYGKDEDGYSEQVVIIQITNDV